MSVAVIDLRQHRRHHIIEAAVVLLLVLALGAATMRVAAEAHEAKVHTAAVVAGLQRELQGVRDFVASVPALLAAVQGAVASDVAGLKAVVSSLAATVAALPSTVSAVLKRLDASIQTSLSQALAKISASGSALIHQVADLNIRTSTDVEVHVVRPLVADALGVLDQLLAGIARLGGAR